jgi:hypothetical protein
MSNQITNFAAINAAALEACPGLLERWFPDGARTGREFRAAI